MTVVLTPAGYEQTRAKLKQLEDRLEELNRRRDLSATHMAEVRRSYEQMIAQYRQEMKVYESQTQTRRSLTH